MIPIKIHTENFEGEAKKVGEVVIGNETIPVYEYHVNVKDFTIDSEVELKKVDEVLIGNNMVPVFIGVTPKPDKIILDYEGFSDQYNETGRYVKGKYEQEFLDMAKKLQDEIEKLNPLALAFIDSNINRYSFYDVEFAGRGSDNPVKGFIQAWTQYGRNWLTWVLTPAVTDKITNDEVFQTVFEKWSLAKFLQLVFGDGFLLAPFPRHGSETEKFEMSGFGNGGLDVGKLTVCHFWTKNGIESNLPEYDNDQNCYFIFSDLMKLSDEELELLHKVLLEERPPRDFYKNLVEEP